MKRNKGMGMVKLIIMILFIILIVVSSVYFIKKEYHEAQIETMQTDMLQVQWKIKDYMDKQTVKGEEKKYLGTKLSEMKDELILKEFLNNNIISENEYEKYYVLKDEDLTTVGLEITNYLDSYFIINYETYEVIVSKGCEYSKGEVLYKLSDIISKSNAEQNAENNVEKNIEE